ncbi:MULTISPECIES: O-antigen ligase family protein [unclassified Lacrimispora]|uniref:O-antigen ligase family protein n=1 Tax=unclassified Lacrimispora TaxID=2719232 RepID=UPI00376F6BAB
MKLKINKNSLAYIWCFFIAISIAVRCLPTIIYQTPGIEYIIIILITVATIIYYSRDILKSNYTVYDLVWLIIPVFFLTGSFNYKYAFYTIIAIAFYMYIQGNPKVITSVKYPLLTFSLITSVVTWISFFAPTFYTNYILSLFPEGSSLTYSFLNRNMYHGFTNHYSRNSFYITVGILILFSELIGKNAKRKNISIAFLAFLFCTEFLVGKRGPTLFLLITIILVILVKEPGVVRRLKNSFKLIVIGVVLFILAYLFVPGVSNIVTRILTPNSTDDISSSRFYLWSVALNMFRSSPIFGHGWGKYLNAVAGSTFQGAHNDYFQLLGEIGIIGLLVYMIADISSLIFTYRAFKRLRSKVYDGTKEQNWIIFSFAYQVFFLLYSLTGLPHYSYEQYALYIMLCGFGASMYKVLKRSQGITGN